MTPRFDAATYPGWRPDGPVEVLADGVRPATLAQQREGLDGLVWSLAHGSNACPDRLIDKGLGGVGALLLPARVRDHVAAWEARRSRFTGAVPLTLAPAPGHVVDGWVLGVPPDSVATLEASEERGRNYDLAVVGDVAVADRWVLTQVAGWAPAEATRVLALDGVAMTWPHHDQAAARRALDGKPPAATGGEVTVLAAARLEPVLAAGWPDTTWGPLPLFVYGSLLPGQSRWPVLEPHVHRVEAATARGRLFDTGRGWPAARFDPDASSTVHGVVAEWRGDVGAVVDELDRVEGHPDLFRRRAVSVEAVGSSSWAMAYEFADSDVPGTRIDSGRWPSWSGLA